MAETLTIDDKTKIFNIINELENNYRFSDKWTDEYDLKVKNMKKLINNFEHNKPKQQKSGFLIKCIGK